MNEGNLEQKPNDLPIGEIAKILLNEGEKAIESPMSLAIRSVENLQEVARGFEQLAAVPYEFTISFEPQIQRWVLTTGQKYRAAHQFDGEFDPELGRRMGHDSRFIHNHPILSERTHSPPSVGDFSAIAGLAINEKKPIISLVITSHGLTQYGFKNAGIVPPLRIRQLWAEICANKGIKAHVENDADIEKISKQEWGQYDGALDELVMTINGTMELYKWEDSMEVEIALSSFFKG
ncbi:MAG: hypothetical protein AAB734_04475 [Patescibacteria group bacterium]